MNNSNIPDRNNPLTYVLSNVQWFFLETLLTGRSWDTGGERPLTRVGCGANSIYYRMPPDLAMPAAPTHQSQFLSNVTNQKKRVPHYWCLVCDQPQLCSVLMASRHVLPCPAMSFHVQMPIPAQICELHAFSPSAPITSPLKSDGLIQM